MPHKKFGIIEIKLIAQVQFRFMIGMTKALRFVSFINDENQT